MPATLLLSGMLASVISTYTMNAALSNLGREVPLPPGLPLVDGHGSHGPVREVWEEYAHPARCVN